MPNEIVVAPRGGFLERLGEGVKTLTGASRDVPFSRYGVANGKAGGLFRDFAGTVPGAAYDYRAAAGELLDNSVIAAGVNAIAQALSSAPPILEKRNGKNWEQVDHELIHLLNRPNKFYGAAHLWAATTGNEVTQGSAFWRIEYLGRRTPQEIWWQDARQVRVLGSESEFISRYEVWVDGRPHPVDQKNIVHFRHALNPNNPREGWTPLRTGYRQVAGDNGAATYHGAILRNSGVMSLLVSVKDATAGSMVSPDQVQAFVDAIRRKLFGEGAGGIAGLNVPLDVQKMSYSPDEMALDKLINYYEARICALIGVDPMVLGIGSGTTMKTYANMSEALNDFWERRIMPTKTRHGDEIEAQMFPLYPDLSTDTHRINWDYSQVAALRENVDGLHSRVREDYKAGVLDLFDARTALGVEADDVMKGKYAVSAKDTAPDDGATIEAMKSLSEIKRFDPSQPRDDDGKWAGGGGNVSKVSRASATLTPTTREAAMERFGVAIPANATDVQMSKGKGEEVWVEYREGAGRKQKRTIKHPDYEARQTAHKFARIAALHHELPALAATLDEEVASGGKNAQQAMTLRLILKTGLRNGGKDGAGKVESFGASSLLTGHAEVSGDRVKLDFVGKEGVRQRHVFHDAQLAEHIRKRQVEGATTIFEGNSDRTLAYLKKITGDKYKVHDLRTYYGTALSAERVHSITQTEGVPKTAKEAKALKQRVAKTVAAHLGNDWEQSLSTYISPMVFAQWDKATAGN